MKRVKVALVMIAATLVALTSFSSMATAAPKTFNLYLSWGNTSGSLEFTSARQFVLYDISASNYGCGAASDSAYVYFEIKVVGSPVTQKTRNAIDVDCAHSRYLTDDQVFNRSEPMNWVRAVLCENVSGTSSCFYDDDKFYNGYT